MEGRYSIALILWVGNLLHLLKGKGSLFILYFSYSFNLLTFTISEFSWLCVLYFWIIIQYYFVYWSNWEPNLFSSYLSLSKLLPLTFLIIISWVIIWFRKFKSYLLNSGQQLKKVSSRSTPSFLFLDLETSLLLIEPSDGNASSFGKLPKFAGTLHCSLLHSAKLDSFHHAFCVASWAFALDSDQYKALSILSWENSK